jgi:hypothetical protein
MVQATSGAFSGLYVEAVSLVFGSRGAGITNRLLLSVPRTDYNRELLARRGNVDRALRDRKMDRKIQPPSISK